MTKGILKDIIPFINALLTARRPDGKEFKHRLSVEYEENGPDSRIIVSIRDKHLRKDEDIPYREFPILNILPRDGYWTQTDIEGYNNNGHISVYQDWDPYVDTWHETEAFDKTDADKDGFLYTENNAVLIAGILDKVEERLRKEDLLLP